MQDRDRARLEGPARANRLDGSACHPAAPGSRPALGPGRAARPAHAPPTPTPTSTSRRTRAWARAVVVLVLAASACASGCVTSTVTALYAPPRCEARRRIEEVRAHRERGAEAVLLEVRYGDGATRWLRLPLTSGPEVRARRVADPAARAAAGEALPVCGLDEAKGRGGALVFQTSHPWVYQVRIPGQPEVRASIDRGRHPARYLTLPLFPVAVALDVGTAPLQGVACLVAPRAYLGWWIVLGYDGP